MAFTDGAKGSGNGKLDLPEGHWMHAAMAREKARIAAKKAGAGKAPGAAAGNPAIGAAVPAVDPRLAALAAAAAPQPGMMPAQGVPPRKPGMM